MPGERLSMRKIREVLRLRFAQGLSQRAIGASVRLSTGAVNSCLSRARLAGVVWPLPDGLSDTQLEALLYPPPPDVATEQRPVPEWAVVHRELRRPNMTLALLWEEYRTGPGALDGFGYSWFCDLYREWVSRLKPTLRQVHTAGERVFVDFAGHTMEVIDGATGEIRSAEVFVAVLGASNYTYAEATWTQSLADWIGAHVRMLAFIGGVPGQIVSDNLRAGITRACFYEPLVNRTYADMATHYGTAVIPARPYKPRDKAKVEVGVQVVQRWILARLRNRRFFSLVELNQAIRELVAQLNDRPMRGWGTTRRALYEQIDRPALLQLPPTPYEYADWKRCRVNLDYHVEIEKHFYSVPFQLLRAEVEARITATTVEIFHRGKLVATHLRSLRAHRPTAAAKIRAARAATASMRCSQISRISRIRLSRRYAMRLGVASSDWTDRPSMDAMAVAVRVGSFSAPRSTNNTAPAKASIKSCPTATATVVLPTPPLPTIVTKRAAISLVESMRASWDRPIIRARRGGRWTCGKAAATVTSTVPRSLDCETGATKQ
jgi:transposase